MTTQANPNVDTTYVEEQEAMLAQVLLSLLYNYYQRWLPRYHYYHYYII